MQVQCRQVSKKFASANVLCDITWTINSGEIVGLLGVSGAGKTTLLRILAGLEDCTAGSVEFWETQSARVPRPIVGMVFQSLALWPHMTARQHVECVLPRQPRGERRRQAEARLEETLLPTTAWDRRPAELSGGEGQRLALARALAVEPRLLLLDEPLAHVDSELRSELLGLVRTLTQVRHITTVYVSHAETELSAVCHQIVELRDGRMQL